LQEEKQLLAALLSYYYTLFSCLTVVKCFYFEVLSQASALSDV